MPGNVGGARPGAGRPKGAPNKAGRELRELAQQYTETALAALVKIAKTGESESARVSAATALLDRGYGRPAQAIEHSGPDGEAIQIGKATADAADFTSAISRLAARGGTPAGAQPVDDGSAGSAEMALAILGASKSAAPNG